MSKIAYIIRFRPFMWDENSQGEMYHNHFSGYVDEVYFDETEFNERVTDLENDYYVDNDGSVYDGVDVDELYWGELHNIGER